MIMCMNRERAIASAASARRSMARMLRVVDIEARLAPRLTEIAMRAEHGNVTAQQILDAIEPLLPPMSAVEAVTQTDREAQNWCIYCGEAAVKGMSPSLCGEHAAATP